MQSAPYSKTTVICFGATLLSFFIILLLSNTRLPEANADIPNTNLLHSVIKILNRYMNTTINATSMHSRHQDTTMTSPLLDLTSSSYIPPLAPRRSLLWLMITSDSFNSSLDERGDDQQPIRGDDQLPIRRDDVQPMRGDFRQLIRGDDQTRRGDDQQLIRGDDRESIRGDDQTRRGDDREPMRGDDRESIRGDGQQQNRGDDRQPIREDDQQPIRPLSEQATSPHGIRHHGKHHRTNSSNFWHRHKLPDPRSTTSPNLNFSSTTINTVTIVDTVSDSGTIVDSVSESYNNSFSYSDSEVKQTTICYNTNEVLIIIGLTCFLNFTFITLVMTCVHFCSAAGNGSKVADYPRLESLVLGDSELSSKRTSSSGGNKSARPHRQYADTLQTQSARAHRQYAVALPTVVRLSGVVAVSEHPVLSTAQS
ncbi:uncharacterized protein LOC111055937 [Nilaparvata lugens]|uniref:uncharacterized protein LOC111055937 n=1 Tax=Nilaparvata lugens TaxID=108931 RepID=UPI00193D97B2|nr:uncharacterized protein LOC111055937 [Nilaparvata lugens]XP_039289759.1 uncharacterized protein LOC111055937 [Nilaparvata lugens]